VTIARRELASLRSEKTIVLALTIQLFVAAFSSFLVVGLVSLYDPGATEGFTVEVAVTGNASAETLAAIDQESGIEGERYDSPAAAREAFRSGAVNSVMVANASPSGEIQVSAVVPDGSLQTTLVVVETRDVLERMERTLRQQYAAEGRLEREPLSLFERVPASPYFAFTYTVLVPLLMFLPAFISGSIAVDSITEEVQRGTLELLRTAPVSLSSIVDAKLLSTALLAPVQAALWLGLLRLNGTRIVHWPALVLVVAGISTAVVAVGVGIALLAPDRRQAQFLYSSGILAIAVVAGLLPEHPANTIAKLAVGSPAETTWVAVAGYLAIGVGFYLLVRLGLARLDAEGL
jgi:ABC-type Na+ efflux pump permease subunit